MWVKHISIVACFLVVLVHAQRRPPPSRTPTTPTSLITTAAPETSETPSTTSGPITGQEGCISKFATTVQSTNRFIVVTKRGRARSFRENHPELVNDTIIQSDGSGRESSVQTVVNPRQVESVRNHFYNSGAEEAAKIGGGGGGGGQNMVPGHICMEKN